MPTFTVSQAAARTGWSPRMLRYLESTGLVVRRRVARRATGATATTTWSSSAGWPSCARRYDVELDDVAFVVRLRRDPKLRTAVEAWLDGATVPAEGASEADWIAWEQRKHEQLLVA